VNKINRENPAEANGNVSSWQVHKRLYLWVMRWADTPYGSPAMGALAFSEAIYFPVPADILLLALCLARPRRSFFFAAVCVTFSIIGGSVAFALGLAIGGERVIAFFDLIHLGPVDLGHRAQQAMGLYQQYDFWAVATAALTPVPYMMFSWLGGISKISFLGFLATSIVFRSIRFFSEAAIIYFVGPPAKRWIEKYFNLASILVIVLIAVVFVILRFVPRLFQ